MKLNPQILKTAAQHITTLQGRVNALEAKIASDAKTYSEALVKKAADEKPATELVAAAKVAADALLDRQLLRTESARDDFAAKIAGDHAQAIAQLTKLAGLTPSAAPTLRKVGSAENYDDAAPATAPSDQRWLDEYNRRKARGA